MAVRKYVWKVEMNSVRYTGMHTSFYVLARSAADAERKGKILAKRDQMTRAYCQSAVLIGEIE